MISDQMPMHQLPPQQYMHHLNADSSQKNFAGEGAQVAIDPISVPYAYHYR
jgi:hypothetical protein